MDSTNNDRTNETAWMLYLKNESLIGHMARKWGLEPCDEQEMIHDAGEPALFRAAKKWSPYKNALFGTYACVCLRNAYVSWMRIQNRLEELPDIDFEFKREPESYDKLYTAMRQLTRQEQTLLVCRHWQFQGFREIAKALQCSTGKAFNLVVSAERALKEKMVEIQKLQHYDM